MILSSQISLFEVNFSTFLLLTTSFQALIDNQHPVWRNLHHILINHKRGEDMKIHTFQSRKNEDISRKISPLEKVATNLKTSPSLLLETKPSEQRT